MASKIGVREFEALADAAERPGGWALFKRKTTERLAKDGLFFEAVHPAYGRVFRITAAGIQAYNEAKPKHVP